MPVLPGQTTLAAVRLAAQQRADAVNNPNIGTDEWNTNIGLSLYELYDLLVQKYEGRYNVADPYYITTDGTNEGYALPDGSATYTLPGGGTASAFYKLLGVDVQVSGGNPEGWMSLQQFSFTDRNRFAYPGYSYWPGPTNLRYQLRGSKLWLVPKPAAALTVRIWYVPRLTAPTADADIIDGVSGWEEFLVIDAAIKAMQKQDFDVGVLLAQKAAIIQRIESAAANRNPGEPAHEIDAEGAAWASPYPYGAHGGWGGGWGGP